MVYGVRHGRQSADLRHADPLHDRRAQHLKATWSLQENAGRYDLWILGPVDFHASFVGVASA
ncbi:phospholipase domain-containing protein [Brevundimonas sp. SORGH_AS_0993]|uniref:phospholipase domain-containing protein n=1 Tax=Brevundimonas sp. SORGH_AS_0993 TaxID=3041794 RepID=UPI00359469C4